MAAIIFSCFSLLIVWSYLYLMLYIHRQWELQEEYRPIAKTINPDINFSILIAARNESKNIVSCLDSILNNVNFYKLCCEIIVVDDYSDDNTVSQVKSLGNPLIHVLQMSDTAFEASESSKKQALSCGLKMAKGDYIVQLDADVIVEKDYLTILGHYITDFQIDFIAGPVKLTGKKSRFMDFQSLDFAGMMGVTQAGIISNSWFMANGANMIFKRQVLSYDLNGLASGDDVYGIQQVKSQGGRIHFLKSRKAIVTSKTVSNISDFYDQRIRWATKNKYMESKRMKLMMLVVFLANWFLLLYVPMYLLIDRSLALVLIFHHLLIMLSIDYLFLRDMRQFFGIDLDVFGFLQCKLYHWSYIIVIGTMSLFVKTYHWKGRELR